MVNWMEALTFRSQSLLQGYLIINIYLNYNYLDTGMFPVHL